jgi:hypothetical protein
MSTIKNNLMPQMGGFFTDFIRKNKPVVAPLPFLGSAKRVSGSFQFQGNLGAGDSYNLEVSPDLKNWSSLESGVSNGSVLEFSDSDASKFSFRFYRAASGEKLFQNVIGYVSVNLPPGFSMVANPFNSPSNCVADLFPQMPEGSTFCKFDTSLFRLSNNAVKQGAWTNPNEKLVPGEGGIFFNPSTEIKTVNFVGDVSQGRLFNPIPPGLSIRSSLVPQSGKLNSDLGFPMAEGDMVHLFDRERQKYVSYPFSAKGWGADAPNINLGESFWISKTQPDSWEQKFFSDK